MPDSATAADRFRALWDAHHVPVRAYLARRCAAVDVDDLVAATFEIAWRRFDRVPTGDAARWWLLATARRTAANQHRARRRRGRLVERLAVQRPDPGRDLVDADVAAALKALRPAEREVLLLSVWDELSGDEVAAVLGVSTGAAHKRLSRARDRFRLAFVTQVSKTGPGRTLEK